MKETENKERLLEVIGLIMHQLTLEEFRTEAVAEVDLLEGETILEINCHQVANTTGANTLRFALPLLQRGLEVMEIQQHWELIGTFAEEVVNMEAQEHQDRRLLITRHLPGHPKAATVAVATTIIEAVGTEMLFNGCS